MKTEHLKQTITQLFEQGKGILAMDESTGTIDQRFALHGIPQTEEMRRRYRELIATTPGLNESIGGAILYEETIRQRTKDGELIIKVLSNSGIIPGIKVDKGASALAGFPKEKVTEGLDGLRERLVEYKSMGLRFAKWRAIISIGDNIPTKTCIDTNAHALARYAALCQESGIVPIVEPEVLMDGTHSLQRCYEVTEQTLKSVFEALYRCRVDLEGIILKPNMILSGTNSAEKNSISEVAEATLRCFLSSVPAAVPAIAFLSGGQSPEQAAQHLNFINKKYKEHLPWIVGFSFARAIQQPCIQAWKGEDGNSRQAQQLLYQRAKLSAAARRGSYTPSMEEEQGFQSSFKNKRTNHHNKIIHKNTDMKTEDKNRKKPATAEKNKDQTSAQKEKSKDVEFPGYPHYPPSEDIYNQAEEVNLDPNDLSKTKTSPPEAGQRNEKSFNEDMTGEDLDVPGSEADESKANSGKEDEENNYYSLGGDRHNDLEEDKG